MNDPGETPRGSAAFYVDPKRGNDGNDGTSPETAFKTVHKISSMSFQKGDEILFKRGETFNGGLTIKGFGTADSPIKVGAYGSGSMPKFHPRGAAAGVTVSACNIVVDGLEIVNPDGQYGVFITPVKDGENENITVQNCYIHDVDIHEAYGFGYLNSGGIIALALGGSPTWYKNMRLQDNTIKNVCRLAIGLNTAWGWRCRTDGTISWILNDYQDDDNGWYPNVDCRITGNTIDGTRGDSILAQCARNLVIEHNTVYRANSSTKAHAQTAMVAVWTISSDNSVMQFNEVGYTTRTSADGEAFDTDHGDTNCKIQYNYSHNNEGGFVLLCNGDKGASEARNATVRYNLSVNDGSKNAVIQLIGSVPGSQVYNNTIYLSAGGDVVGMWGNVDDATKARDVTFTNNIFAAPTPRGAYVGGGSVGDDFYRAVTDIRFNSNLFHNVNLPEQRDGVSLSGNVTGDPQFADSGCAAYEDRAGMIEAFTPTAKVDGAVPIPDNGGQDINGAAITDSAFFGCVRH